MWALIHNWNHGSGFKVWVCKVSSGNVVDQVNMEYFHQLEILVTIYEMFFKIYSVELFSKCVTEHEQTINNSSFVIPRLIFFSLHHDTFTSDGEV